MALRDEQIPTSVVVEIHELRSPAGVLERRAADAARVRGIFESAGSGPAVQRVAFEAERGHDRVGQAVVVVVLDVDSHPGKGPAIVVDRDAGLECDFVERALARVAEENCGTESLATNRSIQPSRS